MSLTANDRPVLTPTLGDRSQNLIKAGNTGTAYQATMPDDGDVFATASFIILGKPASNVVVRVLLAISDIDGTTTHPGTIGEFLFDATASSIKLLAASDTLMFAVSDTLSTFPDGRAGFGLNDLTSQALIGGAVGDVVFVNRLGFRDQFLFSKLF